MILHVVNKPAAFSLCDSLLTNDDRVLLIEDGVYLGLTLNVTAVAIEEDVIARGLGNKLPANITLIDYEGFVDLCAEADKVCSWF